jgi:hypothetical protein
MAGLFYKATNAAGGGLKAAWNFATGNSMLHRRGLKPVYELEACAGLVGGCLGIIIGAPITLISTGSLSATFGVFAACVLAPPVAAHLPVAFYKAGKHDVQKQLADQRRKQAQLPPPRHDPLI